MDEANTNSQVELEQSEVDQQVDGQGTSRFDDNAKTGDPFEFHESDLRIESSEPFVGKWNRLVSTTNWEKGAVIMEWRRSLIEEEAPASAYSDEAWSRLVGGVTSQHVGRLRRVHERFADVCNSYEGLYWSHFQAALDWEDAEMWLEGAVQNKWSISQMRNQRWEAMGADPRIKPDDRDVITAEIDEDYEPLRGGSEEADEHSSEQFDGISGPTFEGPDFGDESDVSEAGAASDESAAVAIESSENSAPVTLRPFENLSDLPDDVTDAFDAFKLAIIRHKSAQWEEITLADLLASLDALKELAKAPLDEQA